MDQKVLQFLSDLNRNNNREWFAENKLVYEKARNQFITIVEQLLLKLGVNQPEYLTLKANDLVFRIYRDVRFSKEKLPYKTHFGAYLALGGRKSPLGGYYLHVEPGNSFLAGGVFRPESENLKAIRNEIYFNLSEFESIVEEAGFKSMFGSINGDKLKRPPVGFPKDFPGIDYLKFKDFTLVHSVKDNQVESNTFVDDAAIVFEAMIPFNSFLNRGMANKPDQLV